MNQWCFATLLMVAGLALWACGDGPVALSPDAPSTASDLPSDTETSTLSDGGVSRDTGTESEITFDHLGACGVNGEATAKGGAYEGFEDHYLIGDEGMGEDLCRVRFDVALLGEPTVPCDECSFAFMLEKRNPSTITDVDGTCAKSALRLDADAIAALDGARMSYGYVPEYWGHANVLMQLDEETGEWEAVTFSTWDEETGELFYDRRDGACGY